MMTSNQTKSFLLAAILTVLLLFLFGVALPAQTLTQTVRGKIVDKQLKTPLLGALVAITDLVPPQGTATDINGQFKITQVSVGRHSFKINMIGYREILLHDVDVSSGKELILNIEMEELINQTNEVVITAKDDKKKPLNSMSTVSARTFSVEETRRFAAAVNDPARAALAYAGVSTAADGNNFIVIRGNAPSGLLWRMEGIDIPNPNHFAIPGASGGAISILSTQLLANSDFMTGAFASEYGNATSGVFDLRLRSGNNEKAEYTFQAGVLGVDFAAEGPLSKKHNGSYLVNYRYSTLGILAKAGVFGDDFGITTFQDLSYNVVIPTEKYGTFSFFGFGGLSSDLFDVKLDSLEWEGEGDRYTSQFTSNTLFSGANWTNQIGEKSLLKIALGASDVNINYKSEYAQDDYSFRLNNREFNDTRRLTGSAVLTSKINAKNTLRSGIVFNQQTFLLYEGVYDEETNQMVENLKQDGETQTLQAYTQWQFRPTERLTINTGFHSLYLALNGNVSVEPRAAVRWEFIPLHNVSIGYGLHNQHLPLPAYFSQSELTDGTIVRPNTKLKFQKAHHLVLAYDHPFGENFRVKAEAYYQWLSNLAVKNSLTDPFAVNNMIAGSYTDSLVNAGIGKNYGLELTLEKFFSKGSYMIASASLYESKYKALDGVWRNSRFNGKYNLTFTGGKEFTMSEKRKGRVVGVNVKLIWSGGFYDTPIDIEKSIALGGTYQDRAKSFTEKNPDYLRLDVGVSLKRNFKKCTTRVSLDIQNTTNRKNVYNRYFDPSSNQIKFNYQAPLIPVLNYRIEF
jgi:hypothetical protein